MEQGPEGRGDAHGADGNGAERVAPPSGPRPARLAMGAAPAPAAGAEPAPAQEASLEMDGVRWAIRVLGRAGSSKARLLLLGFFHPEAPAEARREAVVLGRGLDALTELQMEAAFRSSVPHVPSGTRRPFFAEIASRGLKDG